MLASLVTMQPPLLAAADDTGAPPPAGKPVSLFNGRDFTGWKLPENNIWWKVVDGAIVCQSGPNKRGSNIWTEREFGDFVLEAEFKFDGTGDSGIHLRTEKQQMQIGISGSLKRDMTCSMYIPGKGYPVEAKGIKDLLKIDEWNKVKIVARKNNYRIWLNGEHVYEYTSESAPQRGPIGLQLHGNKVMRAEFRNLTLTELPPEA